MFFFKGLNCVFTSYKNGLIYYKNYLKLNDGGAKDQPMVKSGHQYTRLTGDAKSGEGFTIDALSAEEGKRGITAALAKGTVYGIRQTLVDGGRQQSYFGLNRECVNRDGFPNSNLVSRYLRETAPSTEIKEQRINLYQDVLLAGDFYDNPTPLLAIILLKIQKYRIATRLATHSHELVFKTRDVVAWSTIPDAQQKWTTLRSMIKQGRSGCGIADDDKNITLISRSLMDRVETVTGEVAHNEVMKYTVKVWHMYDYDDGHSKSGSHFGDHMEFVHNRFIVPNDLASTRPVNECFVKFMASEVPTNDNAIKHLKEHKHWINTTNLTEKECTLLQFCLLGNRRTTPLLIDQPYDFDLKPNSVVFVGPEHNILNAVSYTDTDLICMLHKLCSAHRWHEDVLNAAKLLRPWYAQPATETVEAHWWTYLHRVCRIPSLGLKRAAIPCLMLGDAVCTSVEAVREYDTILNSSDTAVVDSMMYNAAWYWGEYMMIMNGKDLKEILSNQKMNIRDELDVATRANVLVSAILGEQIDVCTYTHCYTYIKGGIDAHKAIHARFGYLKIDHLEDYGYGQNNEDILFNSLVAPGAVAMICGRAGSLLDGTPYHSGFRINAQVNEFEDGYVYRGMNYTDLWAYGVVGRWQGYDVRYKHPLRDSPHKIYAANDVSIAMPPTTPCKLRRPENYKFVSVTRRERSWGGSYAHRLMSTQYFYWNTVRFEVMSEPEWHAEVIVREELATNLARYYKTASDIVAETIAKLTAHYDLAVAGFHVEATSVGMPLKSTTTKSGLEQSSSLEQQDRPPDPEMPPQQD